jgi:hypothetical protein
MMIIWDILHFRPEVESISAIRIRMQLVAKENQFTGRR